MAQKSKDRPKKRTEVMGGEGGVWGGVCVEEEQNDSWMNVSMDLRSLACLMSHTSFRMVRISSAFSMSSVATSG